MFTWICPQCGREVPPSYTECPDCAAKTRQAAEKAPEPSPESPLPTATAAFGSPVPPAQSVTAPPPRQPETPVAPAPPAPPVHRPASGMPAWLMTLAFAFAFVGLGASIYWGVNYYRGRNMGGGQPAVVLEHPGIKGAKPHPLQKHLEIAGMRFIGDKKKTEARFLVINHSEAEITSLAGTMTLWGRTQRSEEDAVGTVTFKVPEIGPNQSREVTATVSTKLKIYELPDWQNLTTDLQVTSPPAP